MAAGIAPTATLTSYILLLTSYILHLTSYIIHRSRFAQASVDELQLRLGESAVFIPAHPLKQGSYCFELAVAEEQVPVKQSSAVPVANWTSSAAFLIIRSCQFCQCAHDAASFFFPGMRYKPLLTGVHFLLPTRL